MFLALRGTVSRSARNPTKDFHAAVCSGRFRNSMKFSMMGVSLRHLR